MGCVPGRFGLGGFPFLRFPCAGVRIDWLIAATEGRRGVLAVDEEVSEGIDGVVVEAVFMGAFGETVLGVVVAAQGFDEVCTVGIDAQPGDAVAGAEGSADFFDAFADVTAAVCRSDACGDQLADGAGSGDVVSACS